MDVSLSGIFDPVVRAYFQNRYGGLTGGGVADFVSNGVVAWCKTGNEEPLDLSAWELGTFYKISDCFLAAECTIVSVVPSDLDLVFMRVKDITFDTDGATFSQWGHETYGEVMFSCNDGSADTVGLEAPKGVYVSSTLYNALNYLFVCFDPDKAVVE